MNINPQTYFTSLPVSQQNIINQYSAKTTSNDFANPNFPAYLIGSSVVLTNVLNALKSSGNDPNSYAAQVNKLLVNNLAALTNINAMLASSPGIRSQLAQFLPVLNYGSSASQAAAANAAAITPLANANANPVIPAAVTNAVTTASTLFGVKSEYIYIGAVVLLLIIIFK